MNTLSSTLKGNTVNPNDGVVIWQVNVVLEFDSTLSILIPFVLFVV